MTVAAALSEKIVTPTTAFTLASSIRVADRIIHEHEPRPTQRMTVAQILSQSSNIGTVTLAQMLGRSRVESWIDRFGFGRQTGVDAPGESRGLLPSYWSGSTIGNVPIGQGIGVTPIQMAAAYAAIANGGVQRTPYLVERVGTDWRSRDRGKRVISETVSAQMMAMLRDVVSAEGGTGALAAVPGYTVAGKTGTAAKPERGGYSDSRYVASFVGVVPAKDPRLVVLVSIDEPHGAIWGGVVAAPAFSEIAAASSSSIAQTPGRDRAPDAKRPGLARSEPLRIRLGSVARRWSSSASLPRSHRRRSSAAPTPSRCGTSPTTRAPSRPARRSSACPASTPTDTTSPREAVERGAAALVVERAVEPEVPQLVVPSSRAAMATAADVFFGEPTRELEVAGVTGTNGKTTTAFLLHSILTPPAAAPACSGPSRAGSEARRGRSCARRPRRSTCSGRSARCSTPATAASRSRRRRTPRCCTGSTASASTRSSSRT